MVGLAFLNPVVPNNVKRKQVRRFKKTASLY